MGLTTTPSHHRRTRPPANTYGRRKRERESRGRKGQREGQRKKEKAKQTLKIKERWKRMKKKRKRWNRTGPQQRNLGVLVCDCKLFHLHFGPLSCPCRGFLWSCFNVRLFCTKCRHGFQTSMIRAFGFTFHAACLTCNVCKKPLINDGFYDDDTDQILHLECL